MREALGSLPGVRLRPGHLEGLAVVVRMLPVHAIVQSYVYLLYRVILEREVQGQGRLSKHPRCLGQRSLLTGLRAQA